MTESSWSFIYLFHKQAKGSSNAHFSQNYIEELAPAIVKALNPISLGARPVSIRHAWAQKKHFNKFLFVFQCVACLCIHSREYMGKWLSIPQENSFCRAEPQPSLILGVVLSHCGSASTAGMYPSLVTWVWSLGAQRTRKFQGWKRDIWRGEMIATKPWATQTVC